MDKYVENIIFYTKDSKEAFKPVSKVDNERGSAHLWVKSYFSETT